MATSVRLLFADPCVETLSADAETDGGRPATLGETLADVLDQGTAGSADVANMLSGGNDRGSM